MLLLLLFSSSKQHLKTFSKKIKRASKNHDTKIKTYSFVPELLGLPKESNHDAPRRRKNNKKVLGCNKIIHISFIKQQDSQNYVIGSKKKKKKQKKRKEKKRKEKRKQIRQKTRMKSRSRAPSSLKRKTRASDAPDFLASAATPGNALGLQGLEFRV